MRVQQEQVALFHEKYGYACPDAPELLSIDAMMLRYKLIMEELGEYVDANTAGDLVEVADGLADLAYVVLGTAVAHGIDLQPILEEVHRSNMTKEPAADDPNKPVKGPTFERPRIAPLLLVQACKLDAVVV